MMTFPTYGKNNPNVPNHQPDMDWYGAVPQFNGDHFGVIHRDWSKENLWDLPTYLDLPDQNSDKTKQAYTFIAYHCMITFLKHISQFMSMHDSLQMKHESSEAPSSQISPFTRSKPLALSTPDGSKNLHVSIG